ncbi:FAD-dependent oxidoreductase [Aquicoccus sp. G2-2]|uniref:FAD-dependent oxidoreductase n=1 Tax=Aquicoccus sp. G2-2 TaxID=3092120 RepID=UPI002ADFFE1D|nr:FAD-dependent oxidoreductase [Aquicoccus sp. G2-2]MEA1113931.1 FAD-dependent oxidoreductase [Aquicoccus sp. G2-2]
MDWFKTVETSRVLEEGSVSTEVDGLRIALWAIDGEIYATGNICTHAFAYLTDGHVEDGCIECPLHQGVFDIRSGRALCAPVTKDIATYAVKQDDGFVWVDVNTSGPKPEATPAAKSVIGSDGRTMVVVGAGQAGAETAIAARKHGFGGRIVIVGAEAHPPYERPPLSKNLLLGETTLADAHVFETGQAEELQLELRLGATVAAIDTGEKRISLADGDSLSYDILILATGARPRKLECSGTDSTELHYLRDLGDAERLGAALRKAKSVAIIGGGFIGLELASAARKLGAAVTVIEAQPRLMTRLLPAGPADHLAGIARENGVEIDLGARITHVSDTGVGLGDGRMIEADSIIAGIGAIPNDELAGTAGIKTAERGGILVDMVSRTNLPGVYAVGDVAVRQDRFGGPEIRMESWQNARLSADRAARHIAKLGPAAEDGPWFWSDLFGTTVQIFGHTDADMPVIRRDGDKAPVFMGQDGLGRVKCVIDFGDPSALRAAKALMANGQPLATDGSGASNSKEDDMKHQPIESRFVWPAEGLARVPDWVYTNDEIYEREVERIFHGRTWNYVGLDCEVPNPGDFVRSYVGPTPVVVSRDEDGEVHVFENRCSHRAAEFCRELRGNTAEFVCPYHEWSYDLKGNLAGVPFRRGANGAGGMPADFNPADHGLRKLNVARRGGVIFASYAEDVESIEDYLGEDMLKDYDAVFSGRKLKLFGHYRHTIMGNWKLYPENLKDPYHATLLHTFLVTFGLLVAGNKSAMICDPRGRHSTMASAKSENSVTDENKKEMRAYRDGMTLADPRLMDYVPEFDSPWSVTMQVIWPNLIVQREMNTLGVRQIVPNGPNEFTMIWTMFGYEDDDDEMTRHRLRQGNLMGPAGFLGLEDNEAIKFVQDGMLNSTPAQHMVQLDPDVPAGTSETLISEAAIRALYQHWREEMSL